MFTVYICLPCLAIKQVDSVCGIDFPAGPTLLPPEKAESLTPRAAWVQCKQEERCLSLEALAAFPNWELSSQTIHHYPRVAAWVWLLPSNLSWWLGFASAGPGMSYQPGVLHGNWFHPIIFWQKSSADLTSCSHCRVCMNQSHQKNSREPTSPPICPSFPPEFRLWMSKRPMLQPTTLSASSGEARPSGFKPLFAKTCLGGDLHTELLTLDHVLPGLPKVCPTARKQQPCAIEGWKSNQSWSHLGRTCQKIRW